MGIDGFLDRLEEKRQREAPLPFDTDLLADMIEDDRWPDSRRINVVMPGVKIFRRRKDGVERVYMTQLSIIPNKGMIARNPADLADAGTCALTLDPEDESFALDPLNILLAKEEAELVEKRKRIGRLHAKQRTMDAAARPIRRRILSWTCV